MKINDRVIDRWGEPGTITRYFDDFSACAMSCVTMDGREWCLQQKIPFTDKQLAENWYEVKCDTGGAIWSPESLLQAINF